MLFRPLTVSRVSRVSLKKMTLNIQFNKSALKSEGNRDIHSLPCKIVHEGFANVSTFFTPYIEVDNNGGKTFFLCLCVKCFHCFVYLAKIVSFGLAQTASFRGHPLIGEKINVNENFTGLVISETKISLTEIEQKPMLVNNTFKQINYWNWDYIPSSNDPVPQAMEWLSLSEVVIYSQ